MLALRSTEVLLLETEREGNLVNKRIKIYTGHQIAVTFINLHGISLKFALINYNMNVYSWYINYLAISKHC